MAATEAARANAVGLSIPGPTGRPAVTTLRFNLKAVALILGTLVALGLLTGADVLPWLQPGGLRMPYQPLIGGGIAVLFGWLLSVFSISVVLPLVTLLIWWRNRDVRRVLLLYLGVVAVQLIGETQLSWVFAPIIVPVCGGLLYSSFRVWQLWNFQRYIATVSTLRPIGRRIVRGVLLAGVVIWALNVGFLLAVALPRFAPPRFQLPL